MCGILGIVAKTNVNQMLYDGLTVLQHRGQDAAGIATYQNGKIFLRKSTGMVRDVFHTRHMVGLPGNMGIGHVRYPTAGSFASYAEAQPFYVNCPYGIVLAHNGNLINAAQLKTQLFSDNLRHINTDSDSEILLNIFAYELQNVLLNGSRGNAREDVFKAVDRVHQRCVGGYAVVALVAGIGMVAFRDPNGIRPVCVGRRITEQGEEYIVASESVALTALGFTLMTDVKPAEVILVTEDGVIYSHQDPQLAKSYTPCIFEHVYLARPDSIIDGISVAKARMRLGTALGQKILQEWPNHDIEVVIPVPDTSRTAAMELAHVLGVNYREGFIRNRYIARTFIMPGHSVRKRSVRQKLSVVELEFHDHNVLIVDDSIVRGTTGKEIVQMARDAGANKVYFASASPPVRYQNVYGIDLPSKEELVAHNRSVYDVAYAIGADQVFYQNEDDMVSAVQAGNPQITTFDTSVFSGHYVTGDIDPQYFLALEQQRSDNTKQKQLARNHNVDILNME